MLSFCNSEEEQRVVTALGVLIGELPQRQKRFPWLVGSTGGRMALDAYFPLNGIAVEYDGPQHRAFVPFYHRTIEAFHQAQRRDRLKDRLVTANGLALLRISSDEAHDANSLASRLLEIRASSHAASL